MTVTVEQLMENVRAEDEEKNALQFYLDAAVADVDNFIQRDKIDRPLSDKEKKQYDLVVLFVASDFYVNRSGGGRNNSTSKYTGINALMDSLRYPDFGDALSEVDSDG